MLIEQLQELNPIIICVTKKLAFDDDFYCGPSCAPDDGSYCMPACTPDCWPYNKCYPGEHPPCGPNCSPCTPDAYIPCDPGY